MLSNASSLSPFTQIFPLVVVFFFAATKEAIEDYARYLADKEANNVPHEAIRNGEKIKTLSMNLKPGDFFYMEKGERLPVDALLISSSYEDGTCYIETANLDGETNLKRRSALTELNHLNTVTRVSQLKGRVECEYPNENLNVFTGRLKVENYNSVSLAPSLDQTDTKILPISMSNILLRGCVLRNTDHAYGLVVYTGKNTKIIKNLKEAKQKTSTLEKRLNYFTLAAFVYNAFLLVSSVLFELSDYFSISSREKELAANGVEDYAVQWYLGPADESSATVCLFFVLINNL